MKLLLLIVCIAAAPFLYAQGITGPAGAKAWMLGGSSAAHAEVWSATNNAAAITRVKQFEVGLYNEQRFNEPDLRLTNLSVVVPAKFVHLAAAVHYYGCAAFNQQRLSVSASKALSPLLSLGVQLNYVSTFIADYGYAGNPVLAGGLYLKPFNKLNLGFMVFNPAQNTYGKHTTEKIPSYARLGCAYDLSDKVTLHAETDQRLNQRLMLRGGVYYKIHEQFHLAIGVATHPTYYTFGTVLLVKKIRLDLATSIHEVLGFTPHLGISFPVAKQ